MKILVTGGGGFLGQALCRALLARGHDVTSVSRSRHPALEALGVPQRQADLADRDAVLAAFAGGFDAVLHNAAKAGAWGSHASYFSANVLGTRHVIAACRAQGIPRLVYTSTPSVAHRATHPVEGATADEVPYGEGVKAHYAATKIIAEREALAANGPELATVALRPRLIWGPGDTQILPRLVARARSGRLQVDIVDADAMLGDDLEAGRGGDDRLVDAALADDQGIDLQFGGALGDLLAWGIGRREEDVDVMRVEKLDGVLGQTIMRDEHAPAASAGTGIGHLCASSRLPRIPHRSGWAPFGNTIDQGRYARMLK